MRPQAAANQRLGRVGKAVNGKASQPPDLQNHGVGRSGASPMRETMLSVKKTGKLQAESAAKEEGIGLHQALHCPQIPNPCRPLPQ